jgi:hypothetical protein
VRGECDVVATSEARRGECAEHAVGRGVSGGGNRRNGQDTVREHNLNGG